MSGRERRKGKSGENEVRDLLAERGFQVTALQRNRGDELDTLAYGYGACLAVETKRCNALRLPEWIRQAEAGANPSQIPVVTFRRDREPWYATVRLSDLCQLLDAAYTSGRQDSDAADS